MSNVSHNFREHCFQEKLLKALTAWSQNQSQVGSSSKFSYRKTSTISHTLVGNKIVDNSDVVGASPVGAAPTTSSFST